LKAAFVRTQEDAAEAETDDASNGFDLSILKTRDKFADALAAMNDDVARIYLDPCRTEHLEVYAVLRSWRAKEVADHILHFAD